MTTTTVETAGVEGKVKWRPWHLLWGLVAVGVAMCFPIWSVWHFGAGESFLTAGYFWEAAAMFAEAHRKLPTEVLLVGVYWDCLWKMVVAFWTGEFLSTMVIQRMRGQLLEM